MSQQEDSQTASHIKEEKKFSFANQKWMLTYKTHLVKTEYIEWFTELHGIEPKFIRLCHESGEGKNNTPYEHTHVLINMGKRFQTKNERYWDYKCIHPHIKRITSVKHWQNDLQYIGKEDPANADLLEEEISPAVAVWANETLQEALSKCKKLSDVVPIINLMKFKEKKAVQRHVPEPYGWQEKVVALSNQPWNRKVYWIYDKKGGHGKSQLCDWMLQTNPEKYYVFKSMGGQKDMSQILQGMQESGWCGDTIVIDLPRAARDWEIYTIMESIKDGCFTSLKYQGKTERMEKCHIIVLANWLPRTGGLSTDRWIGAIHALSDSILSEPLNIKEAQTRRILDTIEEEKAKEQEKRAINGWRDKLAEEDERAQDCYAETTAEALARSMNKMKLKRKIIISTPSPHKRTTLPVRTQPMTKRNLDEIPSGAEFTEGELE